MTWRITWFFMERAQLRKMRKLGIEDPELHLVWAYEPEQRGMYMPVPAGCIVGRAAAATTAGTQNDDVARIYPGESGRWVTLESEQAYIVGGRTTGHGNLAQAQAEALRKYRFIVREKMIARAQQDADHMAREAATQAMADELQKRDC